MAKRLKGKVAVVTGGGSGIGRGIVEEFINEGAKVVYFDLKECTESLGEECSCSFNQCDVSNEEQIQKGIETAVNKHGKLDIYVNAAGIGGAPLFITDTPLEMWEAVIKVNLIGSFLGIKHAANQMIKQNTGGVIINVSSLNSTVPNEWMSSYCTSKAGVDMLSEVAAMELGPKNIRVVTINPGFTKTPLLEPVISVPGVTEEVLAKTPLGRMAVPKDIAQTAVFLASDEASFISASHFIVDGGQATQGYPDSMPFVVNAMKAQGLF